MPEGKYGIRDFTDATVDTNPKHRCDVPHEGDPFCGNDNNRRAHAAKQEALAAADGAGVATAPVKPVEPAKPAKPAARQNAPAWRGNA